MAVVNEYKFVGLNANTDNTEKNPFGTNNPLVSETYIIKSIIVKSAGTPTPTVTNNGIVVSELGQAVGYQDLPVEDGDDCEADDNTLNIEPAKKLGWLPTHDVYDYITAEQAK